jgi:hypothetical protein
VDYLIPHNRIKNVQDITDLSRNRIKKIEDDITDSSDKKIKNIEDDITIYHITASKV